VAFDATGPLFEKKLEYNEVVHQLFIDFKRALEDPGVDGRIILRWIFRKWDGGMDWIDLAREWERWWAHVNAVMNFRVP
jgi:hypothetical protein